MVCSSCGSYGTAVSLVHRNSRLLTGTKLHLCRDCEEMEPRWLVVLYGRHYGGPAISKYVKKKLYRGADILAKEIF